MDGTMPKTTRTATKTLALLITLGIITSGCGDTGATFQAAKVCLRDANVQFSDNDQELSMVGAAAGVGAIVTTSGDEEIEAVFEESSDAASKGRDAYANITKATAGASDDATQQFGAAYAYFPKGDTTTEAKRVKACLS